MGNKYGEALGIWELRVGKANLDLKPKKGDNLKLFRLMSEAKTKGELWFLEQFAQFIRGLIIRDHPPTNDQESEELDMYIEFNLVDLLIETQVAFRLAKREDVEKRKKELEKKLTGEE